jgi:hypothetical protein
MTNLKNIYTDSNGIEWRSFETWGDIPANRVIPADLAVRRASMGLNPERLVQAFEEIKQDLNAGKIVDGFAKFDQLQKRINDIPDESLLQDLACVFVIHPDEEPLDFDPKMQRKKIELWKQDEEARFFFIQLAVRYTMDLSDISDAYIRSLILQRSLTELSDPSKSIFPLAETGLMSSQPA